VPQKKPTDSGGGTSARTGDGACPSVLSSAVENPTLKRAVEGIDLGKLQIVDKAPGLGYPAVKQSPKRRH
jgi:hypothetical protein